MSELLLSQLLQLKTKEHLVRTARFLDLKQHLIKKLHSGEELLVNDIGCQDRDKQPVLRFSAAFTLKISELKQRNYILKKATINYLLYWKKENDREYLVILPELYFEREAAG